MLVRIGTEFVDDYAVPDPDTSKDWEPLRTTFADAEDNVGSYQVRFMQTTDLSKQERSRQPEYHLWASVLLRALSDAQKGDEDALQWLESNDQGIASFAWVCTVLGIEGTYVRAAALINYTLSQAGGRRYRLSD